MSSYRPKTDYAGLLAKAKREYEAACVVYAERMLDGAASDQIEAARAACIAARKAREYAAKIWQRSLSEGPW